MVVTHLNINVLGSVFSICLDTKQTCLENFQVLCSHVWLVTNHMGVATLAHVQSISTIAESSIG